MDSSQKVSFSSKQMVLNPYALCWQDDHYYLIGNYEKYDNLIHLRLDRIRDCKILDTKCRHFSQVSPYKDFFDTADYTEKLFGMYTGREAEVKFWCSRDITEQVFDRFSEKIFITDLTDTGFKFKVKAVLSDALVTWIINYGNKLRVEQPAELREMVKTRANEVLSCYGE